MAPFICGGDCEPCGIGGGPYIDGTPFGEGYAISCVGYGEATGLTVPEWLWDGRGTHIGWPPLNIGECPLGPRGAGLGGG